MTATTTGDGAALLSAIEAHPDEDTPRLVFADWLDGQEAVRVPCGACKWHGTVLGTGDAVQAVIDWGKRRENCPACRGAGTVIDATNADRAELIRVQVELARWKPWTCFSDPNRTYQIDPRSYASCGSCAPCRLRARESALLGDGARWRAGPACAACGRGGWVKATPSGVHGRCPECFGTGDGGGLMGRAGQAPAGCKSDWRHRVEFVRGFPRVHCALADVVQTCSRCDGDGKAHGADRPFEGPPGACPVCRGEKQVPTPWALAVARHHRGCELWLDDRTPFDYLDAPKCGWGRDRPTYDGPAPNVLPPWLFDLLPPGNVYDSADLARLALARATAAFARGHLRKETAP